jgi:phosphoglycerate dehydrogenase-like enzyme
MPQKLAVLQPVSDELRREIASRLPHDFIMSIAASPGSREMREVIAEADFAIVLGARVAADVIRAAPRLKLLHVWGIGVDNIDLAAARAAGVTVARTTGSNSIPVAEFTLGLMIATARRITKGHVGLREGRWLKDEIWAESFMLHGKTVGIVGLGAIGTRLAERLLPFGCRVVYTNRRQISADEELRLQVSFRALPELLAESDIVTLHCPLTPETRGLIGRKELAIMKGSAVLLNLARGGIVREPDLVWALETGEIAGAAVDVFEAEPTSPDNPLLRLDNVVATPHVAALAVNNIGNTIEHWLGNMQRFVRGEPLPSRDVVSA